MPLGIVSDADFDSELSKAQTQPTVKYKPPVSIPSDRLDRSDRSDRGRKEGDNNVPDSLRKLIGETSVIEGRQEGVALAREFGISPSSASAYSKGATSTASYDKPESGIVDHIKLAKERISKKARQKLSRALHHITDDKLQFTKPIELASIARNMSAIVKDMTPVTTESGSEKGSSGPTFIFYSPQFREERTFEIIKVNE